MKSGVGVGGCDQWPPCPPPGLRTLTSTSCVGFATAGMSSAASFTGGRETNITVISKLDGRTVAKNQVKHVPGLVLGMGRA